MTEITTALELQRHIEAESQSQGASKYLSNQKNKELREGFERRDDVQKMIRDALPLVSAAVTAWVAQASEKKGRPSAALAPLKALDPDVVALATLSTTFNKLTKNPGVVSISTEIGRTLEIELEALAIQKASPKAAKKFKEKVKGSSKPSASKKQHDRIAEELEVALAWTVTQRTLVGGTVLNHLLTTVPGIFERFIVNDHRGTVPSIRLTIEAAETLAVMSDALAWTMPILKPMVVPPRAWDRIDTGAYLDFALSRQVPLVRTHSREHKRLIVEAISSGAMTECLEGINAIQDTRFAIDERVLAVVEWTQASKLRPSRSFPNQTPPAMPVKTSKEDWEALEPATRSALARRSKATRDVIGAAGAEAGVFNSDLETARLLTDVHAFYLPHNLDFRGRVYALPHFNPQRSDHIKALFHFADAVPMGSEGGAWLMIHLANCGDFGKVSKKSFDARIAWTTENHPAILAAAADPAAHFDFWGAADSPFCFLQACFEYSAWAHSGYSDDFGSTISIALDGSCSGLQHYSAITRSAEEGYHVNLLPRDDVGDIYNVVADQARPTLEAAAHEDPAAQIIIDQGFGRGEVKSNVMTYFYGSAQFGMRDQHMKQTMRPLQDAVDLGESKAHPYAIDTERTDKETGEVTMRLDGGFRCATLLSKHVYAAVVSVAPKADEASQWFQQVAATLAHESLPVIWSTPVGLPVVQRYSEYLNKKVALWLYDRTVTVPTGHDKLDASGNVLSRVEVLVREAPTKRIDKKKARSAISPNVIHSLDGSHLVRTVVMAKAAGIEHFQLIHDSFGTHAGNTTTMAAVIRAAFVSTYDTYCPFQALDAYARSVLSEEGQEKLPAIPAKGDLDLTAIQASLYAFA